MTETQGAVRAHVHWGMKVIAVLELIIFTLMSVDLWRRGEYIVSMLMFSVAILAVYVFFLADSKIDADERGIALTAPHGVYRMDWTEIRSAEFKGKAVYLFGENKALGYNTLFGGKGMRELNQYVTQAVERHQIPIGRPADLKNSSLGRLLKNTRVRGWKLF